MTHPEQPHDLSKLVGRSLRVIRNNSSDAPNLGPVKIIGVDAYPTNKPGLYRKVAIHLEKMPESPDIFSLMNSEKGVIARQNEGGVDEILFEHHADIPCDTLGIRILIYPSES